MTYRSVVCQESTRDAAKMASDVSRENELSARRKPLRAIALCSNAVLPVRAQPVRKATWVAEKASKACMTYGTAAPICSTLDDELAQSRCVASGSRCYIVRVAPSICTGDCATLPSYAKEATTCVKKGFARTLGYGESTR